MRTQPRPLTSFAVLSRMLFRSLYRSQAGLQLTQTCLEAHLPSVVRPRSSAHGLLGLGEDARPRQHTEQHFPPKLTLTCTSEVPRTTWVPLPSTIPHELQAPPSLSPAVGRRAFHALRTNSSAVSGQRLEKLQESSVKQRALPKLTEVIRKAEITVIMDLSASAAWRHCHM